MPSGVKYYSFSEPTGYGLAAVAYVRGLVNAGVPVHWVPLAATASGGIAPLTPEMPNPLLRNAVDDAALCDLPALLAATSRQIDCTTVVAHTTPEHWPQLFEAGRRNVGYTAWEADAPPAHWPPLLERASGICVPCAMNRTQFAGAGVRAPLHVVPHIRRHAWNEFAPSEIATLRGQLGIPAEHFVFYSINAWDPRKAMTLLVRAFVHAFRAGDPVTLLLKTPPVGYAGPPFYGQAPVTGLAQVAIDAAAAETGRPPPSVCLLPYELSGRGIDMLHEIGDCYVSLSHGEGWALGAFDAATRGTPVVMTGWGGQLDYLGPDWPGAIPYRLAAVPILPPLRPSFWPPQRWAIPDFDGAVNALRQAWSAPELHADAAAKIQASIANRYAEPVVVRRLIAALDG